MIAVEVDEGQHKGRDSEDETIRYDDLFMAGHGGKWIYIRFNPDSYVDANGKRIKGFFDSKNVRRPREIERRLGTLKTCVDTHIDRARNEKTTIYSKSFICFSMKIRVSCAIRFPRKTYEYTRATPTPVDSPGSVSRSPRSEPSIVNSLESGARYSRRARDIAEISTHTGEFLLESTGVARYSLRLHARVSLEWFEIGLEHLLISRLHVARGLETAKIL